MKQKNKNITFIFRIPITNYRHNYIYIYLNNILESFTHRFRKHVGFWYRMDCEDDIWPDTICP